MSLDLKNRVVMVSGANRGIGQAIAERLYLEGCRLSLGTRDPEKMRAGFQDLQGERLFFHHYDAFAPESARNWVDATVDRYGCMEALVNNAGILHPVGFEDEDETLLDEMWTVNAKAPLRLTRCAFPHLTSCGHGRVIDVVSMSGKRVNGNWVGYSMSKFAALAASRTARLQGWEHGIRVTTLCPGFVNTGMAAANSSFPAHEMTQPEDLAEITASLLRLPNQAAVPEVLVNCVLEHN